MTRRRDVELRDAQSSDRDFALELDRAVYRELILRQFGTWNDATHRENFEQQWREGRTSIVFWENARVGLVNQEDGPGEVRLNEIQIVPAYQNRGVGTEVVRRIVTRAAERGVPLRACVLRQNRAVAWYRRLGFEVEAESEAYLFLRWSPARPSRALA